MTFPGLPEDWAAALEDELNQPYIKELSRFIEQERCAGLVFPPPEMVFRALSLTPLKKVSVLLLGQDPYHGPGQANGLCFSVQAGTAPPPSLRNIFKELDCDIEGGGCKDGDLTPWAHQGVLLLNAVLTVRAGEAASHKNRGWERFTDAIIRALTRQVQPIVFVLWGNYARRKAPLIPTPHVTIEGVHPSPLSAARGFHGSRPFSAINQALSSLKRPPISW